MNKSDNQGIVSSVGTLFNNWGWHRERVAEGFGHSWLHPIQAQDVDMGTHVRVSDVTMHVAQGNAQMTL